MQSVRLQAGAVFHDAAADDRGEARGPLVYFPMRWSMADEASAYVAILADSMGLVCFDPQLNRLRP
ncbi:hypothetical protein [Streptomyces sp. NPDC086777]|uniref:hypothetical protein n=1 Tax=Streptomyces sp. NPDC086777 TaxID=3154866 RepID=UPI00344BDBC8